jgi:hypothetical protein
MLPSDRTVPVRPVRPAEGRSHPPEVNKKGRCERSPSSATIGLERAILPDSRTHGPPSTGCRRQQHGRMGASGGRTEHGGRPPLRAGRANHDHGRSIPASYWPQAGVWQLGRCILCVACIWRLLTGGGRPPAPWRSSISHGGGGSGAGQSTATPSQPTRESHRLLQNTEHRSQCIDRGRFHDDARVIHILC